LITFFKGSEAGVELFEPRKAISDQVSFGEFQRTATIDFFDEGRAQIRWTEEENNRLAIRPRWKSFARSWEEHSTAHFPNSSRAKVRRYKIRNFDPMPKKIQISGRHFCLSIGEVREKSEKSTLDRFNFLVTVDLQSLSKQMLNSASDGLTSHSVPPTSQLEHIPIHKSGRLHQR
jgi:hypothetical protein